MNNHDDMSKEIICFYNQMIIMWKIYFLVALPGVKNIG